MEVTTPPTTKQDLMTEWMTISDLNDICNINVDTQAKYRSKGTIPHYKIGKRIMYKASEINTWLNSHKAV